MKGICAPFAFAASVLVNGVSAQQASPQPPHSPMRYCWYDETFRFTGQGNAPDGSYIGGPVQLSETGPHSWVFTLPGKDVALGATCPQPQGPVYTAPRRYKISTFIDSADTFDPIAIAFNSNAAMYFTDGRNRVRKYEQGQISTIAGTGGSNYSGDGGPASAATLNSPQGVTVAADGTVYVADTGNQRLRKISPNGRIATVAGNGSRGYGGDHGQATSAELSSPTDVVIDSGGNLYIADSGNHRVREVTPGGIIITFAGNGRVTPSSHLGDGGPATQAEINQPQGLAIDGTGNLYIADSANNCVRKVSAQGIITTIAGTGTSGFSGDGGPATQATLSQPNGVAIDQAGVIFITDAKNQRIRMIDGSGRIFTVAGTGKYGASGDAPVATKVPLWAPQRIAVATGLGGLVFYSDAGSNRIRLLE